ncbi:MAG: hypothetical protein ABSC51_01930 [Gaiellaceae bacterium]|jgi:alpha-tubulin suppressor-like RCC1 family protein
MIARTSRRFAVLGSLLGVMLAILPIGFGGSSAAIASGKLLAARAPQTAVAHARVSAYLTSRRFIAVQASETKLFFTFSRTSKKFALLLERRQGSKWRMVRRVARKGRFRGVHSMTVIKLFGARALKIGSYRLRLSADANSRTLLFRIARAKPLANAVAISSGAGHNCALFGGGSIDCWGYNGSGELGIGVRTTSSPYAVTTAVPVKGITTATAVSAGFIHTCAQLAGGSVECWGYNRNGELGNGTTTNHSPFAISLPVRVERIVSAASTSSGGFHTCVLLRAGSLECWGFGFVGQLGNDSLADSAAPEQVTGVGPIASVSGGGFHTCVLLRTGSIECWGDNEYGQLGDGTSIESPSPVAVKAIAAATAISAGFGHTCALLNDGTVECWGNNESGQLGDGSINSSSVPVRVVGITDAIAVRAGAFHTCALLRGGSIKCWGENRLGQLGDSTTAASPIPVTVHGIANAISISTGYRDSCALVGGGKVECWGDNGVGQLGNGTTVANPIPHSVVYVP